MNSTFIVDEIKKPKLALAPEYHCNPIWGDTDDGDFEYEELKEKLGLDSYLIAKLEHLQSMWDATFVEDNPSSSGFKTKEEELEFDIFALQLLFELKKQLPDYQIRFYSSFF